MAAYFLLQRSRRFHATVSSVVELDVTDLLFYIKRERGAGRDISFLAALIKATGMVVAQFPDLNRHLFHGWFGPRVATFSRVNAGIMVRRKTNSGGEVVFSSSVDDADRLSLGEICARIRHLKTAPLESLEEYQAYRKLLACPKWVAALVSFLLRSSPRFFTGKIKATYAISSLRGIGDFSFVPTQLLSPAAIAFFPGSIQEQPWNQNGKIELRSIFKLGVSIDHFLLDGGPAMEAIQRLKELLTDPRLLEE